MYFHAGESNIFIRCTKLAPDCCSTSSLPWSVIASVVSGTYVSLTSAFWCQWVTWRHNDRDRGERRGKACRMWTFAQTRLFINELRTNDLTSIDLILIPTLVSTLSIFGLIHPPLLVTTQDGGAFPSSFIFNKVIPEGVDYEREVHYFSWTLDFDRCHSVVL